ncbi:hypothetical protein ACPJHQ_26080 [Rossellomorea sp. H39__3]
MKHKPLAPIFFNEKTPPIRSDQPDASRKTRYDKQAVLKFPVTEEQHKQLRYSYVEAKNKKGPNPLRASLNILFSSSGLACAIQKFLDNQMNMLTVGT